jgi:hypothetical protein
MLMPLEASGMNQGKLVFSQLMEFLPLPEFRKCVARYAGERRVRSFSCLDQFYCMAFAQLTGRESLREIELCLRTLPTKLYHMGIRGRISRSTLADANEHRDWRIYADLAHVLIDIARLLYAHEPLGLRLKRAVYVMDSTTIDLCLSLFPWALFRRRKGAIKLHTLIDLRGRIPCFVAISHAKVHDVRGLDDLILEPGATYVMDRGYCDFLRLHRFTHEGAFFVTRAHKNLAFARRASRRVDKNTGLRCDQTIVLTGPKTSLRYPQPLRRIGFVDLDTGKRFVFLTNDFRLAALTICQLYRCRWEVELFFKWIKQHLRIKAFFGTSINAVKTQIWIAVSVYVLLAIARKRLNLPHDLSQILQIAGLTIFEKALLSEVFCYSSPPIETAADTNQLVLFDF